MGAEKSQMGWFSVSRSVGGSTELCGMLLSALALLKSSCRNLWLKDFRGVENVFSGLWSKKIKNRSCLCWVLVFIRTIWCRFRFSHPFCRPGEILKLWPLQWTNSGLLTVDYISTPLLPPHPFGSSQYNAVYNWNFVNVLWGLWRRKEKSKHAVGPMSDSSNCSSDNANDCVCLPQSLLMHRDQDSWLRVVITDIFLACCSFHGVVCSPSLHVHYIVLTPLDRISHGSGFFRKMTGSVP